MKKDEAIKFICDMGFTKRVASKIYNSAMADTDVGESTIKKVIASTMYGKMGDFTNNENNENKEN